MTTKRHHAQQLAQAVSRLHAPEAAAPKKIGRPATGKKSNPEYGAFTVYLRRDSHLQLRKALFPKEISQFVQECVDAFLAKQAPRERRG